MHTWHREGLARCRCYNWRLSFSLSSPVLFLSLACSFARSFTVRKLFLRAFHESDVPQFPARTLEISRNPDDKYFAISSPRYSGTSCGRPVDPKSGIKLRCASSTRPDNFRALNHYYYSNEAMKYAWQCRKMIERGWSKFHKNSSCCSLI